MPTNNTWTTLQAHFTPVRRRRLRRLLGLSLLFLLIWEIAREGRFEQWWETVRFAATDRCRLAYFILVLLLMPVNWGLETYKWRVLISGSWRVSWWTTAKAVLAGISVSLATPNRVGEYGGRALLAPAEQTVQVVYSSILGSICQWIVFLGCGWPALWWTVGSYNAWSATTIWLIGASLPLGLLLSITLMFHRRSRRFVATQVEHNRWWRWLRRKLKTGEPIGNLRLSGALGLALLRFWIYSFQYLLLLWFFGFPLGFIRGITGIFSIYLIQAGIPLPPGFSVITRSELALIAWPDIDFDPLAVVSATFSLYLINLLLPALLGALLIVRRKANN